MIKRYWWMLLVMVPVGALLGLLVAAGVTYAMPTMYESECVIEMRPRVVEDGAFEFDGSWMATRMEMLKSPVVLGRVSERLDLPKRWNVDGETAVGFLRGMVTVGNIRGTDLLSVRVRHTNREEARDIAAEVANGFKSHLTEVEGKEGESRLRELEQAVRAQEDVVEERRKTLAGMVAGGAGTADVQEVKRAFEVEQDLLQTMKIKQMGETVSAKIPHEMVIVHEEPQLGETPVSPNVMMNLTIGAALGLVLPPVVALVLMWLLDRLASPKGSAVRA